jgi:hypothetical protein
MLMGYPLLLGRSDFEGVTLAQFGGASACSGIGAYALNTLSVCFTCGSQHECL